MDKPQTKEEQLANITFLLWHQYPQGITTWGPCSRKCGTKVGARGGGPCAWCLEKDLGELVGEAAANYYHAHIQEIRRLEKSFRKMFHVDQITGNQSSTSLAQEHSGD